MATYTRGYQEAALKARERFARMRATNHLLKAEDVRVLKDRLGWASDGDMARMLFSSTHRILPIFIELHASHATIACPTQPILKHLYLE